MEGPANDLKINRQTLYEIYLHDAHKNAIISVISIYSDISSDADASKNRFGTEFAVYKCEFIILHF